MQPDDTEHVEEGFHAGVLPRSQVYEFLLCANQAVKTRAWAEDVCQGSWKLIFFSVWILKFFANLFQFSRSCKQLNMHRDRIWGIYSQGAPEGVLDRCQFVRVGNEKVPMTPALKAEINKHVKFYGTGELTSVTLHQLFENQIKITQFFQFFTGLHLTSQRFIPAYYLLEWFYL